MTVKAAASRTVQRNGAKQISGFFKKNSMTVALIAVFILFAILTGGRLLYAQNMSNLLLQNGYVLVMACGMLLCILTGGNIDLSIGSVICMVGGLAAVMITNLGWNPYIAILICLLAGIAVGAWQGYWIGFVRIPPFITTLAGMFIFRGIGRLVLDSKTVPVKNTAAPVPPDKHLLALLLKIPCHQDRDSAERYLHDEAVLIGVSGDPF